MLPDAPSQVLIASSIRPEIAEEASPASSSSRTDWTDAGVPELSFYPDRQDSAEAKAAKASDKKKKQGTPYPVDLDANGNPIPLEQQQPKRILGFMPNFRSVSAGTVPPKPSWGTNFKVASHQAFDYSSFLFLGITSLSAEGINSHPVLGKGVDGFWAYTWRGFLDKTDGTYLSAFALPSLLHEDTRYYGLGHGTIFRRSLYVISRQAVARTYSGRETPNIAGLGGKVLTQVVSRTYYPAGATDFGTLATKFGYSVMRDVAFTSIREFYPTIAAHYIRKHRQKMLQQAQP
ncbi:hypothetical protein [Granulicella sibirica]|uniref:Uncharacterized protein n=1 Tax=Granulicella sibirica TaxID=2479048 RepID=A0A4Q0T0K2_9BACT|nr:hypothetical protein [Granulicella sibirica]RXH57095.1 hypothetical protein GRAN_0405 [Granulicella sibirica]